MSKQSSAKMSKLAAQILRMSDYEISALDPAEVRSLAASVLSQDETPLITKIWNAVTLKG